MAGRGRPAHFTLGGRAGTIDHRAGRDTDIALAPDGRRLAFTTRIERTRVWSPPRRGSRPGLRNGAAGTGGGRCSAFVLSRDGRQLAFVVDRAGKQELRKKSLADGSETLLVAADGMFRQGLRWTSDGSRLAMYTLAA